MEKWSEKIDKNTQDFVETFGELSIEQLNWKPNSETWSIAQNIDHLMVINKTYFPIINSIRNGTYRTSFLAKLGFIVSFFERTVLKAVQPDRKKKMKTFSIWEPTKSEVPIGILDRFKEHQSELKNMLENSRDLVEEETIISSPANKNIVYSLGAAFEIIVTHEQRHFGQAKEVYEMMKNKAKS